MGGCRCSYRSCTLATNGKTHFFHYPVRDSTRCAKWIANANRPDFHHLSHSQLKNKVVCEYHFIDRMFVSYRHDRLIHTAIPTLDNNSEEKSDFSSPNESLSKQTDVEIEPQNSFTLLTDVPPTDKEVSTMTVNVSPVTGFSFIPPHEKRSKNTAPYIELLTRQHSNYHSVKRSATNQKLSKNKNFNSGTDDSQLSSNGDDLLRQQISHCNESKDNEEEPVSNTIIITDLFKTPPKSISNIYNKKVKDTDIPRKKQNLREWIINDKNNPIGSQCRGEHTGKKIEILSDTIVSERSSEMECKPRLLNMKCDPSSQNIDESTTSSAKVSCTISDPVSVIHQQLLQYSKQKSFQTNNIHQKKTLDNKIDKIPLSHNEEQLMPIVHEPKIDESSLNNDYMKLIRRNSKEISELKQILLGRRAGKKFSSFKRKTIQKLSRPKRLSKEGLYAQIVPYLSPELARKVHTEMFPSTLRYKR